MFHGLRPLGSALFGPGDPRLAAVTVLWLFRGMQVVGVYGLGVGKGLVVLRFAADGLYTQAGHEGQRLHRRTRQDELAMRELPTYHTPSILPDDANRSPAARRCFTSYCGSWSPAVRRCFSQ